MAKIILNVELAKSNVVKNLKELEAGIQGIGKSLGDVKVNKNLTAQLNALTRQYNALAKAAKEAQKVDNKQAIEKEKLAKVTAQASTAKINEQKATVQLQTAQVRLTKAQESGAKVVKKSTEENEKHRQSILSMAQGFFQWQMAATLVMKPLQMVRQAWASINETLVKTEDAVISLQRVLNEPNLDDSTISGKLYDLAQRYGQTFDNVNDIAQNFARTGMSWNETIQATESALLALNVAELDATQASEGMIAIMKQFGYEASELTGIIDMLNKVADNFSVTTDRLLTALQRTGSSAKNAKLDLAETVGIITALSEATGRSGENIGTAVNSLIQYSSKDSSLDTFASLDKNTADVVAKYRKGGATILDVWMAVSSVINNMDSRQESILAGLANSEDMTDLNQELQDELGDIFETISDVYGTANTFRKNYFVALMGNMQTVKDAIDTANDANGYSQKENEKYLETYTAKVNQLNAKWQELANNEQGLLKIKKDLVEMGISALELVENVGGIEGVLKIALAALTPFIAKWTIAFGAKGIAAVKSFWLAMQQGALTTNQMLGAWSIALSLVVAIMNKIQQAREDEIQKVKEERQAIIDNYEAHKKEAESLVDLYNRFLELESITEKTNEQQNEFNTVTESIVNNLGYEAYELDKLTKGTEEYTKALKKQTEAKIKDYALEASNNAFAQKKKLDELAFFAEISADDVPVGAFNYDGIEKRFISYFNNKNDDPISWLRDGLFKGEWNYDKYTYKTGFSATANPLSDLDFYRNYQEWLYDNGFGETEFYSTISNIVENYKEKVFPYLEAQIESLFLKNASGNGIEWTQENADKIIEGLLQDELYEKGINSEYLKDFIRNYAKDFFGIVEKNNNQNTEKTDEWNDTVETTISNYKDLLDVLNGIMNEEKEIVNLEEKKQAIQERQLELEKAKKALEDARNNKTVYQYNAKTGTWERVADEKAIADAEEGVKNAEQAVEKAEQDYQDALWNSIESDIKTGTLTTQDILEKIQDFPQLTTALIKWLKDEGYAVPEDLSFGPSGTIPPTNSGMSTNNNNSTTNNTNYNVNGIPITQEQAEQYTVVEIIEQVANMPN